MAIPTMELIKNDVWKSPEETFERRLSDIFHCTSYCPVLKSTAISGESVFGKKVVTIFYSFNFSGIASYLAIGIPASDVPT